jgi:regulator of RNase E activity RraA
MPGRPGFRIHDWKRLDSKIFDAFGDAAPAQIADCMSRLGGMDSGIRPVWASPRVIGSALTVWCHSGDNLMIHKSISLAIPGDILVVNTQGNVTSACVGELIATSAMKAGVRAVIVDGAVRDIDALEWMRLPVYARGISPASCNKDGGGEIGAIVACGGVAVRSGDIVVADRDGVTVVPQDDAFEVARMAHEQVDRENKRKAEIEKGVLVRPEIDEALRRLKIIE